MIIAGIVIINFWRRRRSEATVSGVDDVEEEEDEARNRDGEELAV